MKVLKIRSFYSIVFFIAMSPLATMALAQQSGNGAAVNKNLETSDVMGMMDQDKDGKVSKQEWKGEPKAFSKYDSDKSGYIEANEIPAKELGPPPFDTMDTNGDGQLSKEEFLGGDRVFKILDKNADGVLQGSEDPTSKKSTGKSGQGAATGAAPVGATSSNK
jgi:hypothetical protein